MIDNFPFLSKLLQRQDIWSSRLTTQPHKDFIIGLLLFRIGAFFLASSSLLSGLCFVPALVLGSLNRRIKYHKDPWTIPLICIAILMLIGSFKAYTGWLAIVGLGNWLPFFWAFWAFQPYLRDSQQRKIVALCILSGTVPVFVTGLGQIWFGWSGPWEIFNGLIVWFVDSGGSPDGRLSGLFDYANIAGAWLVTVWPFSFAFLLSANMDRFKRSIFFLFAITNTIALVLTNSRNAWGGLTIAVPFVLGTSTWYWLLPLLSFFLLPVAIAVFPAFNLDLQIFARKIVPEEIWVRLSDMRFAESRSFASTRLGQWSVALQFIFERPWLGWGAAAFSVLYPLRTGLWHGHAHNLPLDLAVSHGFLVALIFVSMVLALLIVSLRKEVRLGGMFRTVDLRNKIFDRAWWTATLVLLSLHATDMPFFDSRINILGWILLSGLRCTILPKYLSL